MITNTYNEDIINEVSYKKYKTRSFYLNHILQLSNSRKMKKRSVSLFMVLFSILIQLASSSRLNPRTFDEVPNMNLIANEMQLLHPENIKTRPAPTASTVNPDIKVTVYQIQTVSPLLINNDDVVTVSYFSSDPYTNDWIAAYSPADVDITKTVPIKYGWCDEDPSYAGTGFGQLQFNLTNLRSNVVFYYFINGLYYPVNVYEASNMVVNFNNYNEPVRPRVVPTGNYNIFQLLYTRSVIVF